MPLRDELNAIRNTIETLCNTAQIEPVSGDTAPGQEIITSIWEEIGRATLLIARQGTEQRLERSFPSIAKRRCHLHPERPESSAAFIKQLQGFLRFVAVWVLGCCQHYPAHTVAVEGVDHLWLES